MEYLKRVLGIEVLYENKALEHLPNFINTRYVSQRVFLNGTKSWFFCIQKRIGAGGKQLKKHLERVEKECGLSCGVGSGTNHGTAKRVFASRESSIYCRWKANISAFHGGVFAGTL